MRPKTFIATHNTSSDEGFAEAVVFLGISLVVSVLIFYAAETTKEEDVWKGLLKSAVDAIATVVLWGGSVRAAWWIVGGRAPARSIFGAYMYFYGVGIVISAFLALALVGVLKHDPVLYAAYIKLSEKQSQGWHNTNPDFFKLFDLNYTLMVASILVVSVGLALIATWSVICWGAYRQLNNLSRSKSFLAFMLFALMALAALAILSPIEGAMFFKVAPQPN